MLVAQLVAGNHGKTQRQTPGSTHFPLKLQSSDVSATVETFHEAHDIVEEESARKEHRLAQIWFLSAIARAETMEDRLTESFEKDKES